MNNRRDRKNKIDVQGHRGARGLYPENTIPSFIAAVQLGVDTLEMDVVVSGDGLIVVSHEPWMNPVICTAPGGETISENTEQQYNLYTMNYSTIAAFDCGQRPHPEFVHQQKMPAVKPLLRDVFETVESFTEENHLSPVVYNIEVKSEPGHDGIFQPAPRDYVRLLLAELKRHACFSRVYLQSFDVRILQEIRNQDPRMRMALLVENNESLQQNLDHLGFKPDIYSPGFWLVTEELVEELKRQGIALIPWTVNEIPDMERLLGRGVDGLITDYPDRLIRLLNKA